MAKIEMPPEPSVDRLWTRRDKDSWNEWRRATDPDDLGWVLQRSDGGYTRRSWRSLIDQGPVYTTHPDLAALERYPTPWWIGNGGTIRAAGTSGKVVLDPTIQCPACVTKLIVKAVNFFAEHYTPSASAKTEDEKR